MDENDFSENPRILVYLEHSIQDARIEKDGQRRLISRRMQYVEILSHDAATAQQRNAGYAPYLDYRPLEEAEKSLVRSHLHKLGLADDIEAQARNYAITHLVPQHLAEVRQRKEELTDKTERAVKDRLTKEINYWDQQAEKLRLEEQAGKTNAKLNSTKARQRADELANRLEKRLSELQQERQISPLPPVVVGAALVIPIGLWQKWQGTESLNPPTFARDTKRVEMAAMQAVMAIEQALGYEPKDVSSGKCGYDIESRVPETGRLRFIEVKGRIEGADTVTITKNEIITALNKPEDYILALVQVPPDQNLSPSQGLTGDESVGEYYINGCVVRYVKQPFHRQPDFGVASVNYHWQELWQKNN